jgi:hypothetical protein
VVVDVGAAEGILSLDVIEMAMSVVLFECEDVWIEALNATFEPWKSKVEIVPQLVGAKNDVKKGKTTLDTYFRNIGDNTGVVIKLDVEGMEKQVISGADNLLRNNVTNLFVCTYHNRGDFKELSGILKSYGFKLTATDGYMYNHGFRKGLVRGHRDFAGASKSH